MFSIVVKRIFILIWGFVIICQLNQSSLIVKAVSPMNGVDLALNPPAINPKKDTNYKLKLTINSGNNKVSIVGVELKYDPNVLTINKVKQGDFLTGVLSAAEIGEGKVKFIYIAPPTSGGIKGSGTLAVISIKAKSANSTITFGRQTFVGAINQAGNPITTNALRHAVGSNIYTTTSASSTPSTNDFASTKNISKIFRTSTTNFFQKIIFWWKTVLHNIEDFFHVKLTFKKTVSVNQIKPEPDRINQIEEGNSVNLFLVPSTSKTTFDSTSFQTISLKADSGTHKLSVVKFQINYNPIDLTVSTVRPGTWLTQILKPITIQKGMITGIIAAKPDSSDNGGPELNRTGTGTLLTFLVKPKSTGTFPITINKKATLALVIGNNNNVLSNVAKATITVIKPGDFNGDGKVDFLDYNVLVAGYGKIYNLADYKNFIRNYAK